MIILLTIAFILFYCSGLYFWIKKTNWRLSEKTTLLLKYFHYAFLVLSLCSVLFHFAYHLDLRGIWTSRIMVVGLLTTGMIFYPFAHKEKMKPLEKIYFLAFSFLPVFIAGLLLVPFFGMIVLLSFWEQLTNPVSKIHYEDQSLRIQSSFSGVLGPSQLDVIEKNGLFEKSHYSSITHDKHFDSLKVRYEQHTAHIIFKSINKFVDPEQVITIKDIE